MRVNTWIKLRKGKFLSKIISHILIRKGIDIPPEVQIGKNVEFPHNSIGTVIHNNTVIEDNVKIYQNVTLGRADIYKTYKNSKMKSIVIKENAIICAGAKVLCKEGTLTIGKNSIVAANAVLLNSIGDNEIWAGIPAKKIKTISQEEKI